MLRGFNRGALFAPLAAVGVIALALLLGGCFFVSAIVDNLSRTREQTVVFHGMASKRQEIARSLSAQLSWDEAVRHLDNHFDRAWARDNIGRFFHDTQGIAKSFVLDAGDRPLIASKGGREAPTAIFKPVQPKVQAVIAQVRAAEAQRNRGGAVMTPLNDSLQSDTIALVDGVPYIFTATLVQPDFGTARIKGSKAPIVVTGMEIGKDFLAAFGRRYMLDNLRLHKVGSGWEPSGAYIPLLSDAGSLVATLDWQSQRPGAMLLRNLAVPMFAFVSVFIGIALILHRRSWRVAQNLIASEARASHLAYHDHLTGLPNRVMFFDRLSVAIDQARRSGKSVAVHCIDLDRFKDINDTFGHQIGDELIRGAAQRMASICRRGDTVARLSGDEFAIVQIEATPRRAGRLAARLVKATAEPFDLSSGQIFSGCSVGTTLVTEAAMEPIEAVRHADLALYRAKQGGRNQYRFFEPEMDAAIRFRRTMEDDLRQALVAGDLYMVYQPQSDRRGMMSGVEALVRWHHPERGDTSPGFFVPIAEECGLIAELGMFTLRRAFEDSRRWPGLTVAINVSATQLRLKDFLPKLKALVEEMGVRPSNFELEITEGLLLGDDPVTHETLANVRRMGFSIALDDFGTGYSSLSYLQQYPIDKIKIDRSFIINLGVERGSEAVVMAIVKLARALKLRVIAEGVETEEQLRHLIAMGCGETQGYLLSPPVAVEQIDRLYHMSEAA